MSEIIFLPGNVKYNITLDPSVWIFDDRKATLEDFYSDVKEAGSKEQSDPNQDPYQDRKKKRYKKEQWLVESFVMPAGIFIENSSPSSDAKTVIFHTSDEKEQDVALNDVLSGAFAFSKDGKAISDDGPIHFYYGDGSNIDTPIVAIKKITIK